MIAKLLRQPKKGIRGLDEAKKINGRKQHVLVGTEGFLLAAEVTRTDKNNRMGLKSLLKKRQCRRLKLIFADIGYEGQRTQSMVKEYGRHLEIVKRPSKWY